MKHMFIKSMAIAATLMLAWNCSDESSSNPAQTANDTQPFTVTSEVWWIVTDQSSYLIQQPNENGVQLVTDAWSKPVGVYNSADKSISDINSGAVIMTDVDLSTLLRITPERTVIGLDGTVTNLDNNTVIKPADPIEIPQSSSSTPVVVVTTSSSAPASSAEISSSADTTANVSSAAKDSVSSSSAKSSSSSAKSSSSSEQKSSSSKGNGGQNDPEASKYEGAGRGGQQGWATRYWDCCMPSCGWNENSGGNPTKYCDAKGKNFVQGGQSICSGGQNTTCTSQIPIIASDKVAYAFAAVPAADGGKCGKCFALTFTGGGKYESKANHQALQGKTLVVMASNIGGDVNHGQFDIMIPGGGRGAFDGCGQMGWGSQGEQYGGLLSDCEKQVGYDGDLLSKRKECLKNKCNEVFKNDEQAKEGCMFLATWMEAAGNPNHEFKEVECPQALKAKW